MSVSENQYGGDLPSGVTVVNTCNRRVILLFQRSIPQDSTIGSKCSVLCGNCSNKCKIADVYNKDTSKITKGDYSYKLVNTGIKCIAFQACIVCVRGTLVLGRQYVLQFKLDRREISHEYAVFRVPSMRTNSRGKQIPKKILWDAYGPGCTRTVGYDFDSFGPNKLSTVRPFSWSRQPPSPIRTDAKRKRSEEDVGPQRPANFTYFTTKDRDEMFDI